MIIDTMLNWQIYPYGPAWKIAFDFLTSLTAEITEGDYPLQGNQVFARVMSYPTRSPAEAVLEAHQKYVDIQTTLVGAEGIEWFPTSSLTVKTPYDEAKDVAFFYRPAQGPARVDVFPGTFVTLWPHDAHMPMLVVGGQVEQIKKAVVKIAVELL